MRNSARGKGHEEGGSAHAKAGSSLRKFSSINPRNQSLPIFCFVLSRKKKKKKTKDKDLVKTAKGQAEKREPAKRQKEQSDKAGRTAGLLLNVLTNYFLQLLCFT